MPDLFFGGDPVVSVPFLLFLHLLQITVFVLALRHLDVFEREPLLIVLAMFVWGGLIATFLTLTVANPIVDGALNLDPVTDALYGAAITAPLSEETTKGLALVLVFTIAYMWSRRRRITSEFGGVTDGIVYGAAVGFGFAFVENILYLYRETVQSGPVSGQEVLLLRVDFFGVNSFGHGLYTACLGAGLGYALWTRSRVRQVLAVAGGLVAAMALHASWNGFAMWSLVRQYGRDAMVGLMVNNTLPPGVSEAQLVASFEQAQGYSELIFTIAVIGMGAVFWMWLRYERRVIAYELAEEANNGLITAQEYQLLPTVRTRYRDYLARLRRGESLVAIRQLHDRLTDLAVMKWRARMFGGDATRIDHARAEIRLLREYQVDLARLTVAPAVATSPATAAPQATPPPATPPPSASPTGPPTTTPPAPA